MRIKINTMTLETKKRINGILQITPAIFMIILIINSLNIVNRYYPFLFGIWMSLEMIVVGIWALFSGYFAFTLQIHTTEAFGKKARIVGLIFTIIGIWGISILIPASQYLR